MLSKRARNGRIMRRDGRARVVLFSNRVQRPFSCLRCTRVTHTRVVSCTKQPARDARGDLPGPTAAARPRDPPTHTPARVVSLLSCVGCMCVRTDTPPRATCEPPSTRIGELHFANPRVNSVRLGGLRGGAEGGVWGGSEEVGFIHLTYGSAKSHLQAKNGVCVYVRILCFYVALLNLYQTSELLTLSANRPGYVISSPLCMDSAPRIGQSEHYHR